MEVKEIIEWWFSLLKRQNREQLKATGEPFYKYKVSNEEFDELRNILTQVLNDSNHYMHPSFNDHLSIFPHLYVLYAAEWWRNKYKGGTLDLFRN